LYGVPIPIVRTFLIAPSLTRLIHKEFRSQRVVEGHFAPQGDRQSYVRMEKSHAHLVLTSLDAPPEVDEDITEVPAAHAEALFEASTGTIRFERSLWHFQK